MNLTTKLLRHPRLAITMAALLLLMALCLRAGETNTPSTNAPATTAETNNPPLPPKPKLLSTPSTIGPQWKTVYILPAALGAHLPAVRVGTNIVPNVLLVVCDRVDLERLSKLGFQPGQADIEVVTQVK